MLHGDGVDLKPFSIEDLEFLYKWNNDPEYVGGYEPFEPVTEEELLSWLSEPKKGQMWFIIQAKDGERMGQLVVIEKSGKTVQLGYRMAPPYRNKGHCTDAVKTIIRHLFVRTDTEIVTAGANPRNTASWRVLEKAGLIRIGYKEKALEIDGLWLDGYTYELRREQV